MAWLAKGAGYRTDCTTYSLQNPPALHRWTALWMVLFCRNHSTLGRRRLTVAMTQLAAPAQLLLLPRWKLTIKVLLLLPGASPRLGCQARAAPA